MTKSIIIEVYSDVGDGRPKHIMKARLLGACTKEEGNLLLCNLKAAAKIHTKESCTLKDTGKAMSEIMDKSIVNKNFGKIVAALKEIDGVEVLTRKLFVSSTITLTTLENFKQLNKPAELEGLCEDKTYITLKEIAK